MNKGCIISLVALLVLVTAGLGYYFVQQADEENQGIEVTKAEIKDIIKKTVATGSIKPRQEVQIKPQVSGVIEQLFIEPGEIVKKGQQLARVKLIPNEVNINNAQSNVELARIRYKDAQRELERQKAIFGKRLDVENARVNLANAKKEEQRAKDMLDEGILAEQEYQRFKVDLELRKAEFDNANITSENSLRQFETEVDVRKQELDAAINNLQLLREGVTRNSKQISTGISSTIPSTVETTTLEICL
ncbi:MAG: biotin/lipoyl-binding protein, partial [Bacteroidota bacterium]